MTERHVSEILCCVKTELWTYANTLFSLIQCVVLVLPYHMCSLYIVCNSLASLVLIVELKAHRLMEETLKLFLIPRGTPAYENEREKKKTQ